MKRTLHILSITVLIAGLLVTFTSCQPKTSPDSKTLSAVDTAGLAQFQALKAMEEQKAANMQYIQGYKDAMETKVAAKPKVVYKKAPVAVTQPAPAAQPAKKKGWSKAAKGTVIGTTAGATAGALLYKKNRVLGGIVGGILGGGIGYGVGRSMDKKDGRL